MSGQWEPVPSAHLVTVSLLPLAVIVLVLGSGAFMAVTKRYRWLLIPAGVIGVTTGFALYVRERRRWTALACRMGGRGNTLPRLMRAGLGVAPPLVPHRRPQI